jgi:hypothetical protein
MEVLNVYGLSVFLYRILPATPPTTCPVISVYILRQDSDFNDYAVNICEKISLIFRLMTTTHQAPGQAPTMRWLYTGLHWSYTEDPMGVDEIL